MNSERVLDGPRMPNPLHWDRELSLTQEALAASRPLPISHLASHASHPPQYLAGQKRRERVSRHPPIREASGIGEPLEDPRLNPSLSFDTTPPNGINNVGRIGGAYGTTFV